MDKLQVLIIEDDADTARYYQYALDLLGYEGEIVYTAKAALARLAGKVPHLILLDMRLGSEVDGEDILYQIRSNPRLDKTRVIVITAYPIMTRTIINLADLILIKPVELSQLKDMISRITLPEYFTKQLSFRDPVTELFNREFFYIRLEHAYERAQRRPDFIYAVLALSLYGEDQASLEAQRATWNRLLKEVSLRLLQQLRPTDTLTRLSGWKFAALVEELKTVSDVRIVISRLQERLVDPFLIDAKSYQFNSIFGSAVYDRQLEHPHVGQPGEGRPRELLDQAERALEQAQGSDQPGFIASVS